MPDKEWTTEEFARVSVDVLIQYERVDAIIYNPEPGSVIYGAIDYDTYKIFLHTEHKEFHGRRETLIHEILHGYYQMMGEKVKHSRVRRETTALEKLLWENE